MTRNEDIDSMLKQIVENQRMALELQREHLDLARAQLERSNQSINESLELQRAAVARQSMLTRLLLPLVGVLLALLMYLLVRWNVF
jgi:hypothetical protein